MGDHGGQGGLPSMEGEEEFRELSDFLGHQRMQYDELRHVYDEKKRVLQELHKECAHLEGLAFANQGQKLSFEQQVQALNKSINEVKEEINTWDFRCASYRHVKSRLTNDKIVMDKRVEEMKTISEEAEREYQNVLKMTIKQKQLRDLLLRKRQEMELKLDQNREKREKQLASAQRGLKEQVRMQDRRQTREKRRRQIALEVAGDLGVEEERRLKALYAQKKLHVKTLSSTREKNAAQTNVLQEGFDKIKLATGFTDLNEIVEKYLTREKTYAALHKASAEMEASIEEAVTKNEELSKQLSELQLEDVTGQGKRNLYKDIDDKDARVKEARKVCNEHKERAHKSRMVLQSIRQCVGKLWQTLQPQTPSQPRSTEIPMPPANELPGLVKKIQAQVGVMLEELARSIQESNANASTKLSRPNSSIDDMHSNAGSSRINSPLPPASPISGSGVLSDSSTNAKRHSNAQTRRAARAVANTGEEKKMSSKQASDVLFNSIMAVEPDTSPRNIRVPIDGRSPPPSRPASAVGQAPAQFVVDPDNMTSAGAPIVEAILTEENADDEHEADFVMSRKDIKRVGAQVIQAVQNREKNQAKVMRASFVEQNLAAERLMQGNSATVATKKEMSDEPWNIAKGEQAIDLDFDDPFAKQAKELQQRRVRQRNGNDDKFQDTLKAQTSRRNLKRPSMKENEARTPRPPVGETSPRKRKSTVGRPKRRSVIRANV